MANLVPVLVVLGHSRLLELNNGKEAYSTVYSICSPAVVYGGVDNYFFLSIGSEICQDQEKELNLT